MLAHHPSPTVIARPFQLLLVLILAPALSFAAPEKILPKTLVLKPVEYYRQQAEAWRLETSRNKTNGAAWLNYYAAATYAQQSSPELQKIVVEMTAAVPNTYEWLLVKGWNDGYQHSARNFLVQAYVMDASRPDAYGLLQRSSEFTLDKEKRQTFSQLLSNTGQISSSLLNYSYNVLMSVERSAVLITEGESTTTPLYVLQDLMKVRSDVTILDLDMLVQPDYMQKKLQAAGISMTGPLNSENLKRTLCSSLPQSNKERKFYYALTLSKDNLTSMRESLYVVGLASLHSPGNVDNLSQIRKNLEKEFLLDYLKVDFNGESQDATGKVLNANYLVPMVLLYESYKKEGNQIKAAELRLFMEQIARERGKEETIARLLDETTGETVPYFPFLIDIKTLDGQFRIYMDKLWAQESEVTNAQYNRFLNYLKSNSLNDLHAKYTFDFSELTEPALSMMRNYAADRVPTKKNRFFTNYPAVNISYESAMAYCQWLTDQYNHTPDRKFRRVKFRLPSIQEWQLAAASIKNPTSMEWDDQLVEVRISKDPKEMFPKDAVATKVSLKDPSIKYPWFRVWYFRSTALNNRGCWLGNFNVPDTVTCPSMIKMRTPGVSADGYSNMAATRSYFPNDIGLYDVVGNVAEMTLEKGKACGGSWNHTPEESTMRSVNLYTKPDATVGFRVFMEILEK